jgi:hypothetical protein
MSTERAYEIIGKFISSTASFEYVINVAIESIIENDKLIDYIQRQGFDIRIEFIKHNILLAKNWHDKSGVFVASSIKDLYKPITDKLDEILEWHREYKPYRDLLAHSPLFYVRLIEEKTPYHKLISSRRYDKHRVNSLKIQRIEEINTKMESRIDELSNTLNDILIYCHLVFDVQTVKKDFP